MTAQLKALLFASGWDNLETHRKQLIELLVSAQPSSSLNSMPDSSFGMRRDSVNTVISTPGLAISLKWAYPLFVS